MDNSGYHDCPCRDCFEIAIGEDEDGEPSLCHACETAGCDADGESECDAPHAYGQHCGDTKCCGELHPAIEAEEIPAHAPGNDWYSKCPQCSRSLWNAGGE